ncbi:MAG: prepilin-type N-terminal cleavage/methylation domain-containing protein [Clostridium sp.]|nr:prepilin-type N-terminal cleavage/methylation domain-containing protein [Clostridium sp.]
MFKFTNKRKGFTIIEVMSSLSIITIMFLTAAYIKLCSTKVEIYSEKMDKATEYLDEVKTDILSNVSNSKMDDMVYKGNIYMPAKYIDNSILLKNDVVQLFQNEKPSKYPYIQISATKGYMEKIKIDLYLVVCGKNEKISAEFYKGNYT